MKKTVRSVLRRGLLKNIRFKWLIVILVVVCSSFFSTYINFRFIDRATRLQNGYQLYGDYQIYLENVPYSTISKLTSIEDVNCISYFFLDTVEDTMNGKRILYADRNIIDLYHYSLVDGKYPDNTDEVLCEQRYWDRYLDNKPLNECTVYIGEKEYKVSGLVTKREYWITEGTNVPDFIFSIDCLEKEKLNCSNVHILIQTDTADIKTFKTQIITGLKIDSSKVHYNLDAVYFAGFDNQLIDYDPVYLVCDVMIYFIVLFMAGLLAAIIIVFLSKLRNNLAVCKALGVRHREIVLALVEAIIWLILPSSIMPPIIALCADAQIMKSNLNWAEVIWKNIFFTGLFVGALLFFSIPAFLKKKSNSIAAELANKESVRISTAVKYNAKKETLNDSMFPFWRLAKYNISRKSSLRFFSVAGFILAMIITSSFLFLLHYASADWGEYRYDYRVEYDNTYVIDTDDGASIGIEEYEKITEQNEFDYYPYYYCISSLSMDKNKISEEYKQFLIAEDETMYALFDRPKNKRVTIPTVIILADESTISKVYGLGNDCIPADGECVLVSNVKCIPNGYYDTGLKIGDELKYYTEESDFNYQDTWPSITVSSTIDKMDFPLGNGYYSIIILVNKNDYDKINLYRNYSYPYILYLSDKENTTAVSAFFKKCTFMSVTNLKEEKEYVENSLLISKIILFSMSIMLILIVSVYSILAFLNKFANDQKQLSTLKALGIPTYKRFLFLIYEFVSSLPLTLIIGALFSILSDYCVNSFLKRSLGYFPFRIPAYTLIVPMTAILISYLIMIPIAIIKMKGLNIAESLQKE